MEEFSYDAKIAVIKVLTEILYADNIVHEKEVNYLNEVIQLFGLNEDYKTDANNLLTLKALSIIRGLSAGKHLPEGHRPGISPRRPCR